VSGTAKKRNPSSAKNQPPEVTFEASESTTQVLARAQAGDRAAGLTLIERALPALRRWSHGRIPTHGRGPADTEDVVQDAVLDALQRLDAFEHRTVVALQGYLRKTVISRICDVVRRVGRRGVPAELPENLQDSAHTPLELAILQEEIERFLEALQKLRASDRQIVVWRLELGYSYDEIAARLGKSTAAARMAINRAMKLLAEELRIDPTGQAAQDPSGAQ
jgi:RNA polymerase sigma factor (sigma-70 family)